MELRLLHLSDIHFLHLGRLKHLDFDEDLRNEFELDIENITRVDGSINAILISGDIAFSGNENEYLNATIWLKKICNICNCLEENVLPVPGNHDIDRNSIGASLSAIHDRFKQLRDRDLIDNELKKYLLKDEDFEFLVKPLRNYCAFAQKYNAIPSKNALYWEKDLPINDHILRIRGLNSTIISNSNDDEHSSKLILGGHQTILKREKGVIYLTLCHHPAQWLYDADNTEDDLNARALIQLYGHKHIFKVAKINNSLRLSSGALHPSKGEKSWEPRYNIIGLSIQNESDKWFLKVRLWERIWDKHEKTFSAKFNKNALAFSEFKLELDYFDSQIVLREEEKMDDKSPSTQKKEIELINLTSPDPKRKLAYIFFELPFHTRIEIAGELNLNDDSDVNLSPIQKSQSYFKRAVERNLLFQLWEKIAQINSDIKELPNPFK